MRFKKLLILIERYLPLVLMSVFIFIQSSRRAVVVSYNGEVNFLLHKLAHVVVYIFLYITAVRAFKNLKKALIFTILYAISDEYHQMFVQTRTASWRDVIIDSVSASIIYLILKRNSKKLPYLLKNFLDL
jgi:VanZ family protein